jgi:hypothetical protein
VVAVSAKILDEAADPVWCLLAHGSFARGRCGGSTTPLA